MLAVLALAGIGFVIAGDDPAPGTETAGTAPVEPTSPGSVEVAGPPRTEPLAPGESIPAFSAPGMDASGLDGTTVRWSDYEGAPAVLTVWAPWCPHCQVELPILDRVMDRNPDVGFVSVVTSIGDQPGPTPDGYLRDRGLSFPVAVDDVDGTLAQAFGIGGFPTIYFVASDGTVVQVAEGEVDEATLESIVTSLT